MAMEGTMRVHSTRTAKLALGSFALVGALALTGCVDSAAPEGEATTPVEEFTPVPYDEGTTMAALAEAGTITIGTKFTQPLFGLAGPDGIPVGFDVEIGKIIAMNLGIDSADIEWKETVSANREPFIQSGEVDIVIATYTINDTRKQVVSFAGPYYEAGQDIMVAAGNPEGVTGPDWFTENPDAVVCTVNGSTSLTNISEYTSNILAAADYADCLEPIRTGQAVAVTTDNVILAGLAAQNEGEFEVLGETFTAEPYGIGLALDDEAFRMWINDVLEQAYEDGSWDAAWEATAGTVLDLPEPPAVDRY